VKAALSRTIIPEAFEQSLASQGTVAHNDGHATCWPCTVCAITGSLEVGETAALHKLIKDLQNALAQATGWIAALAMGLWSGHAACHGADIDVNEVN